MEMWRLSGDVEATWRWGGYVEMWRLSVDVEASWRLRGDVVANWRCSG